MTPLAPEVREALGRSQTVDMTTMGRRTGQPRRIEIMVHSIDGRLLISGQPGFPRGWMANLNADPTIILHLRRPPADVPSTARVVTDTAEREMLLAPIARLWRIPLAAMVEGAPLIEVTPTDRD
jgi:deazaflavin-dependent oxidoreductase (nitroreductase family)